jgi:hypothetical protein
MATPNSTFTAGAVYTAAQANNFPFGVVSRKYDNSAILTVNSTTETAFFSAPAFTPIAGRLYRITYTIGYVAKLTNNGNIDIRLRKDNLTGTILVSSLYSSLGVNVYVPFSTSIFLTSAEMGTTSFVPFITIQANTSGFTAGNAGDTKGTILVEDIGLA